MLKKYEYLLQFRSNETKGEIYLDTHVELGSIKACRKTQEAIEKEQGLTGVAIRSFQLLREYEEEDKQ